MVINLRSWGILAILVGILSLSGCAFTDSLLLKREVDSVGRELYIESADPEGPLTVDPIGPDGVPNEPAYSNQPAEAPRSFATMIGNIWGVGGWTGAGVGVLSTIYAFLRGKRRFNKAKAVGELMAETLAFLIDLINDIKSGKLDTDADGKISIAEIKSYISARGKEALDPAFLDRIVTIVSKSSDPAADLKKLVTVA